MMTRHEQVKELIHRYMDSWNRHDAKAIAESFIDDGVYEDTAMQTSFTNEGIAEYAEASFEHTPDIKFAFTGDISVVSDNRVILQTVMSGHRTSDGTYSEIELAEFIELQGEKIKAVKVYYDDEAENKAASLWFKQHEGLAKPKTKYQRSGMDGKQLIINKLRLLELMATEKLFTNNELTMPVLAGKMGISNNHLSQLINSQFEMNFFELINHYRIEEAKSLMAVMGDDKKESILEVALSVGFNSTSTFYSAFKKFSGMTPAQYKKSLLKS